MARVYNTAPPAKSYHDRVLAAWSFAFVLTLLVETPVYFLCLRRVLGARGAVLASLGLNVSTHPLAWWLIMRAGWPSPWPVRFVIAEILVWLVEAALLVGASRIPVSRRQLSPGEALVISLVANSGSAGIGLLLSG